jgi:tRNA pseudouridine55 synthase
VNGILLIDKPKGWTSFDVVNKVRRIIEQSGLNQTGKKRFPVGHTGTLDPLATGLLVLLLGDYTKRAPELSKFDKTYEVTMRLGITSTTGDEEGEKTTISDIRPIREELETVMKAFEGEIEQVPPIYSAVKVNGQRAYKLARKGQAVKLEPRKVKVYSVQLTDYNYPEVKFTAQVSSGTYIRSLVEDIGQKLSSGAYMSDLRRTAVGTFLLQDAFAIEQVGPETIHKNMQSLD